MAAIPGLTIEPIVDNIIKVDYGKDLDALDEETKKVETKKIRDYLLGAGKVFIQQQIDRITSLYDALMSAVKSIQTSITQTTASNMVPSVITTGAATSVPNPAYSAIENSQKKNTILATLSTATSQGEDLKSAAQSIHFELPGAVTSVIDQVGTLTSLAEAIPG